MTTTAGGSRKNYGSTFSGTKVRIHCHCLGWCFYHSCSTSKASILSQRDLLICPIFSKLVGYVFKSVCDAKVLFRYITIATWSGMSKQIQQLFLVSSFRDTREIYRYCFYLSSALATSCLETITLSSLHLIQNRISLSGPCVFKGKSLTQTETTGKTSIFYYRCLFSPSRFAVILGIKAATRHTNNGHIPCVEKSAR